MRRVITLLSLALPLAAFAAAVAVNESSLVGCADLPHPDHRL